MGSPISIIVAEIFLQCFENLLIKHHSENRSLIYYNRYVDDILIIYDKTTIQHHQILQQANTIHNNLTFNHTLENNGIINFIDLSSLRTNSNFQICIYRKPTTTDNIIHYNSNHPQEHQMAAFRFLITRMQCLPLNPQQKQIEWTNMLHIAESNRYPTSIINKLNTQIHYKLQQPNRYTKPTNKKWVIFTFHSPVIRKITNIFRDTNLKITFRTNNTL
jgi:hypothetical protein